MLAQSVTRGFWRGRRVFVTGHTGFMGGWLCAWLTRLGAEVHGYALPAATAPNLYGALRLDQAVASTIGDVRDLDRLTAALCRSRADIVFHLAAQPLVRHAYAEPVETYGVNVMGTVNLLEAMRRTGMGAAAVIVTTDKVYENKEWPWGYREADTLGGGEPYGSSKACAELVVDAYRRSYFAGAAAPGIATARAGNIIGGGDWAADRLVPDAVRAFSAGRVLEIRQAGAVRPWQHVLDPLRGFLMLAERLAEKPHSAGPHWSSGWNFGPPETEARTVAWIADRLADHWGDDARWQTLPSRGPHEAQLLMLSSLKARAELGWRCDWTADMAVRRAVEWYRIFYESGEPRDVTACQIASFEGDWKHDNQHGDQAAREPGAREPVSLS